MAQRTKQKSKSKSGFKLPARKKLESLLKKCSKTFLAKTILFLLAKVPKKVQLTVAMRIEKAPKSTNKKRKKSRRKSSKRKTKKRKTKKRKTKRKSTKRKTKRKSKKRR